MTAKKRERSLVCSIPGCALRWTTAFPQRLCADHAGRFKSETLARQPSLLVPTMTTLRDVARPFSEPAEREGDAA